MVAMSLLWILMMTFHSEVPVDITIKLKHFRMQKDLTQKELSRMSGVSQQAIFKIEQGTMPRVDTLIKLADSLGVNLFELIGRH